MGGGEDTGYEEKQAKIEAEKQRARDALNAQFGAPTAMAAPSRDAFTKQGGQRFASNGGGGDGADGFYVDDPGTFDEAGFNAARSQYDTAKTTGGTRDALYQTVRDNAFNSGKMKLDEQKAEAARKLKFELFARGQNGGSEDINQNALLGRTYSTGLIDLGAKADAAKADFRGNDESSRLGLLQSIDSGTDQGSAISSALSQMQVNADKAASEATGTTLGDLFANVGLISNQGQARAGKAAGQQDWWNTYNPTGGKATKAANGSITTLG
jgi:hypothetical protein